ncbi:MAG: SseB family protein [Kocuria sp.]|nr:SseB family protein [Kocuria sp.]
MTPPRSSGHRPLPEHIAAQLRSAGGATDTGGQPWAGRDLSRGHHQQFADDQGAPDTQLACVLEAWQRAAVDENAVVAALADTRLFVPVMAEVARSQITSDGLVADKEADMLLVTLQAADGRQAQPVFTTDQLVTQWHSQARPVAAHVRKITLAAVKDNTELLVLNPGSGAPFVVRRPALWALAKGQEWEPSYGSQQVSHAVLNAGLGLDGVVGAHIRRGRGVEAAHGTALRGGGLGPELTIVLQLAAGMSREQLERVLGKFQAGLAAQEAIAQLVDSLEISVQMV